MSIYLLYILADQKTGGRRKDVIVLAGLSCLQADRSDPEARTKGGLIVTGQGSGGIPCLLR